MNSNAHAAISLVVAGLALAFTTPPVPAWVVVAVALVAGVGIDLDHFLLARYRGDWGAVRRCLRDPRILFVDQEAIFEEGTVGAIRRLLSHVVIAGLVVPLVWLASPYLAGVVAAALYAHLLADLYATERSMVAVDVPDAVAAGLPVPDGKRDVDAPASAADAEPADERAHEDETTAPE